MDISQLELAVNAVSILETLEKMSYAFAKLMFSGSFLALRSSCWRGGGAASRKHDYIILTPLNPVFI